MAGTVAVAFTLPSLSVGWVADDYIHRAYLLEHLRGGTTHGPWWNMFDSEHTTASLIPVGGLPWWTSKNLRIALLRPLATISQYSDYWLWPDHPALMHLHNIVLYGVIVLVVADLYARLLERRLTVWIAALLYAIDDAHVLGTSWIASRNTLLTALFCFLTLSAYHHARSEPGALARWVGPVTLLCAHASSEGAIGVWGYLLAYAAFLDLAPRAQRWLALLPYLLVTVSWLGMSAAFHYGVHSSGAYLDPRLYPVAFVKQLADRGPPLLLAQFGITWELALHLDSRVVMAIHIGTTALLLVGVVLAIRQLKERPTLRFLLLGTFASLLPICAVGPVGRLLFLSGFGTHALIAELLSACALPSVRARLVGPARALGALFAAMIVCIALIGARGAPEWWKSSHRLFYRAALSLPRGKDLEGSVIMMINTPDYLTVSFIAVYRRFLAAPAPVYMHILGVSRRAVRISRPNKYDVELQTKAGYLEDAASRLVRPIEERFEPGQTIDLFSAQIGIEDVTPDGRPSRIRVRTFDAGDSHYLWTAWDATRGRYVPVAIPNIGGTLVWPAESVPLKE